MAEPQLVKLVAVLPLRYHRNLKPGDEFEALPAYAQFFTKRGLARLAGDAEPVRIKRKYRRRDIQGKQLTHPTATAE